MTASAPRVLLIGASGLLGGHLADRLPRSFATTAALGRAGGAGSDDRVHWLGDGIDAADPATIGRALAAADPAVIVNAVGAGAQVDADAMTRVNTWFPRELARQADARGARVVHISTDAVFSGQRGAYAEADPPDPIDHYGRSKQDGELAAPHLTIRTSFFGRTPRRTGLIEWLVSKRGQAVDGFADYRFSGMAAPLLADLIVAAIDARLEGVYHVGGDPLTKYQLLCAAADHMGLNVSVRPVSRRPTDRTLDAGRFFSAAGRQRPTVADSIQALTICGLLSRS